MKYLMHVLKMQVKAYSYSYMVETSLYYLAMVRGIVGVNMRAVLSHL